MQGKARTGFLDCVLPSAALQLAPCDSRLWLRDQAANSWWSSLTLDGQVGLACASDPFLRDALAAEVA